MFSLFSKISIILSNIFSFSEYIVTTLLIRLITMPFTKKAALQSENLKKAQPELERLEKKYKECGFPTTAIAKVCAKLESNKIN